MNSIIMNILRPLGIPVSFQTYSGSSSTYITFLIYNEFGQLYAENDEVSTRYSVQVDVWSKTDYTDLVKRVKKAMKDAGFNRTFATDLYEDDTKIYHKAMRFSYTSTPE